MRTRHLYETTITVKLFSRKPKGYKLHVDLHSWQQYPRVKLVDQIVTGVPNFGAESGGTRFTPITHQQYAKESLYIVLSTRSDTESPSTSVSDRRVWWLLFKCSRGAIYNTLLLQFTQRQVIDVAKTYILIPVYMCNELLMI